MMKRSGGRVGGIRKGKEGRLFAFSLHIELRLSIILTHSKDTYSSMFEHYAIWHIW
jgi:hypothetical protein